MLKKITLSDAWDLYKEQHPVSLKCAKVDNYFWVSYIFPILGSMELPQIKSLDLLTLRKSAEQKLSPQSVHHCLSLTRRLLRKAVQWELYQGPLPHFEMPRFDNRRMRFLTPNEAKDLLFSLRLRSELWSDITQFALNTGLRSIELFNLQTYNVSIEHRLVYIMDGKSSTTRSIPLNNISLAVAEKYYSSKKIFYLCPKDEKLMP